MFKVIKIFRLFLKSWKDASIFKKKVLSMHWTRIISRSLDIVNFWCCSTKINKICLQSGVLIVTGYARQDITKILIWWQIYNPLKSSNNKWHTLTPKQIVQRSAGISMLRKLINKIKDWLQISSHSGYWKQKILVNIQDISFLKLF